MEKAIEALRKKGGIKAAKKADRATNEGLVAIAREGNKVAVVTLACETDFVAKNEDFITAVSDYAKKLISTTEEEFKTWAEENIVGELVVKIGENLQLGDFGVIEGDAGSSGSERSLWVTAPEADQRRARYNRHGGDAPFSLAVDHQSCVDGR